MMMSSLTLKKRTGALRARRAARLMYAASLVSFFQGIAPISGNAQNAASPPAYRSDRILVRPKLETSWTALRDFHLAQNCKVLQTFQSIGGMQILRVPAGETVPGLVAKYEQSGLVEFAE